jgi:D-alanine-D-alanine ligase
VALIERFVRGVEIAVPVIEAGDGPQALPSVEIRPDSGVYDYAARYSAGATEFVVPASIPPEIALTCARVAVAAHECLGLRDISRSDLIVDEAGVVWFLEANVSPGMTDTSSLPLSAEVAGRPIGSLFGDLVERAVHRIREVSHS